MVGIVGFGNLNIMQYLKKYTTILDANETKYEVVYWNRAGICEAVDFRGKAIAYEKPINTYQPFYKKIIGFLCYTAFMYKTVKSKRYDKLIILTTQTAIPLYPLLIGKYRGKYVYDYRDITKEKKLGIYLKMVKKLIENSAFTAFSSKGFWRELGIDENEKTLVSHNTQKSCEKSEYKARKTEQTPIKLVYWGMVRQVEFNKYVCDCFGNDDRFNVVYHGEGYYKELSEYCEQKKYKNISFTGRYEFSQISDFVESTDILNCLYENDETQKPAMPVKLYDAVHYRLPVIVTADSYLQEFSKGAKGSFAFGNEGKISDAVFDWYKDLSAQDIEEGYGALEKQIYCDDKIFENKLLLFVKESVGV